MKHLARPRFALALLLACAGDPATEPRTEKPVCPEQAGTVVAGRLAAPDLTEASGLAASTAQPDLLWSTNDSGDEARLFALGKDGRDRGQVRLDGVTAQDIEDVALGRDESGTSYLYAADIGDNLRARVNVAIYRIPEPSVAGPPLDARAAAETMTFTYGDQARHDAETLLFDPRSRELFVVTKEKGAGRLFRLGKFAVGSVVAEDLGAVPVDTATGGAIAPDGKSVVVRDYSGTAKLWVIEPGKSLQEAMRLAPCSVALGLDLQGEAICFDTDSRTIFTTSEGKNAPLHRTEPAK